MSALTAAYHCPTELTFVSADELDNVVTFTAPSKSKQGAVNTVQLCIQTGETLCDCRGAECGRQCWHQTLAPSAWLNHVAVCGARRLGGEQLATRGQQLAGMCATYRQRTGRALPLDAVGLLAARTVWRERERAARAALAPVVAFPEAMEAAA
jgi:hypothetical protein